MSQLVAEEIGFGQGWNCPFPTPPTCPSTNLQEFIWSRGEPTFVNPNYLLPVKNRLSFIESIQLWHIQNKHFQCF